MTQTPSTPDHPHVPTHGLTNKIVQIFLNSNLPIVLIVLAVAIGFAALQVTPREEDPQIIVPLADVYVNFPGHSAPEVEQLVATPLEKILYQIDGVEYVYSMSMPDQAVITVRFLVGQDRERSLVKLYKTINANLDIVPPGVTGWVVKPVEIDDVPIVTLTLAPKGDGPQPTSQASTQPSTQPDEYVLRRVAEELVERLAAVADTSRATIVGGLPRVSHVYLDSERMQAYHVSPLEIRRAIEGANVTATAGQFDRSDKVIAVQAGRAFQRPEELRSLAVGVFADRPVFLKDVADIVDGPAEVDSYVRHGWGPGQAVESKEGAAGTVIGSAPTVGRHTQPAVTIALAKKKGTNAVQVSDTILAAASQLQREVVPDNIEMIVTRNAGLTSNDKVNELIEALGVALVFAIVVLVLGLGWRESLIVALAVPVVFGLTLGVNYLFGYTINRVTLFALILSLGLLVDDPIVDVENIARHFRLRRKVTRQVVLEAVSEIRPPLITATLAVIFSFIPLFFITGMMGPYMAPMALNVPVTMLMSMAVAFTITPWLAYHILKRRYTRLAETASQAPEQDPHGMGDVQRSLLYRGFRPLMSPLLKHRWAGWLFLGCIGLLMVLAVGLAATRQVPLKMLPYSNRNDFQLVLDMDRGTTLERTDAAVREMEKYLAGVPEVTDFTSYVGLAAPMDFNGMVRHYYQRRGGELADIQVNLVDRKDRAETSHGLVLRVRNDLTAIARKHGAGLKIVEAPPGPPVIATVTAEVYGRPDQQYQELLDAAGTVHARLAREPGIVDVANTIQAPQTKLVFVTDKEKAAVNGVSVEDIARAIQTGLDGATVGTIQLLGERNPLRIELRMPRAARSDRDALSRLHVKSLSGDLVSLAELGTWEDSLADQMIYHKNLQRVAYVFGETAGRAPADAVVDIQADQRPLAQAPSQGNVVREGSGWTLDAGAMPVAGRTFLTPGGGALWAVPEGIQVQLAGEGEWKLTIDVFRDMGLAFIAALVAIYILLVAQTGSFVIPLVVMMAIPLTIIGIMPGFWLLNHVSGGSIGGYANPVFFTATGMIGMIALAGIVTRSSIILVDFIHLSLARGRSLFDAILESCVVRLRPILLTAATAMLSAFPITTDPIFSGLAWSLIFGLLASTVFTLFVIPVIYWLLYGKKAALLVRRR